MIGPESGPAGRKWPADGPLTACRIALGVLIVVTALPEVIFWLSDAGFVGSPRWRLTAYQNGAFWSGLLRDWRPNYALQPVTMFLTYAVLHSGPAHLIGNLAGMVWLGLAVCRRLGARNLVLVHVGAAICGAATFGLISPAFQPMIGASGAVFGLAGALTPRLRGPGADPRAAILWIVFVMAVNAATWAYEDGALAWQTHLGGFVAGMVLGWTLSRRREGPRS